MSKFNSKELIRCLRQAFIDEMEAHWVVFAHGTVVKLPRSSNEDVWGRSIDMLRKHELSFFDDFPIHKLPGVEGWLVEIKEYAFYVYVHPSEMQWTDVNKINMEDLSITGKEKFAADARSPQPVYVHLQPVSRD